MVPAAGNVAGTYAAHDDGGVHEMVLLRRVIGDALRARRLAQHRTLRDVSTDANVSLGYLSEIERGHKEASSELLASICDALGAQLSDVLRQVSDTMALAEQMEHLVPDTEPVGADASSVSESPVTEGGVTVSVHRDGPLKTTLMAKRTGTAPGQRRPDAASLV